MLAKLARGSSFNDIEQPDMTELPKLHRAAYSKDVERVGEILSRRRVDIDKRDSRGRTAFHYGCLAGSTEVIELLHSHCPDLHLRTDSQGRCPAYLAIKHGHLDCLKLLFVYGKNFDEKDDSGICPLHFAITEHQTEIAKFLIKNGNADLNAKDPHLLTALHHACANGLLSTAKLLVQSGVKINAKDCYGRTPLILAAADGSEECVRMLIENGANPEVSDRRGLTAKAWALKKDHHRLLPILDGTSSQSTSGCKMDSEDSAEKTALKQMANTPESTKGQDNGIPLKGSKPCDHDASPRSCEDGGEPSCSSFSESDGFVQAVTSSPSETVFLLESSSAEIKNNVNLEKSSKDYNELINIPDKDPTDNAKKSNRSHVRFAENPEVVQYGISSDNQSSAEMMLTTSEQSSSQEATTSVSENSVQPKIWDDIVLSETQEQVNKEEGANVNIGSDRINERRRMSNVIYSKESFERDLVNSCKECSASDVPEITMTLYDDTDEEEFPNRHSAEPVMDYSSSASEEFTLVVEQPACRPSREFIAKKFDDKGLIDSSLVSVNVTGAKSCIAESSSETEFLIRSNINLRKASKTSSNEIDIEDMTPANLGGCSSTKIISLKENNEKLVKELFHSIQDFCVTEKRAEGLEDKLNRLACNLKIEKARAEHEHLVANDLERNVSALKQLQSQLQEDLDRAREHSRCKDYENNILKTKLGSIISCIKERSMKAIVSTSRDNIDHELFKVVESSENVLQEIKANGESGFNLEKDLLKDKLLLISEKTELRKKARELQCSNEYFEKKVIKLNNECVKKAKENRVLQEKLEELKAEFHFEKHPRLSDIEKSSFVKTDLDGIEIGTCTPVLSNTEDAEVTSHPGANVGSQKAFEDKPVCCQHDKLSRAFSEGSCCLQFDKASTEIPKGNHTKKRKIAEELKLRFVDKGEELKRELIQARTDLQLEKEKVRRLSLHDELKDRFVISLESLQNELSLLKRKKEASLTCAKTRGDFDKLIQEEKSKFNAKLMEQNKTINLLRECISETRQSQSKYMQLYADAKLKADRYDELVGSNLQLEEALNEAYKRIDELKQSVDKYAESKHHHLDIEGNAAYPTVYFVRNGTDEVEKLENLVKCEQLIGKRLQNLRESGSSLGAVDSGCEENPARYLIFNENQTGKVAEQLANLEDGDGNFAGVRMVEASHSQGQLLLELQNAKAKIKNLLCTTSDVNEQKQYMVEKIEHLKKENAKLAKTISEAAGKADSHKAATAKINSEVSNESTELARELWKTRQSLGESEKENLKLKEEIRALEGKFVKIKEKAEKFGQNDDTMISMEDILEENASLMETNEEIVEKYKELLKKINGSPDENASSYKMDEDNETRSFEGSGIAAQGSDKYKENNAKFVGFSDDLVHGEMVNSVFEQTRRNTLISSDIKLSDLVRAMNSDTSGDDTDDDIDDHEIIEHVRRASIRYYEGGCKADGSLLEEVEKLTHANNSLKDKVAFLEGWTDSLNEELLRLQTDLEAAENDKKAFSEKLQRQINKCNALESDIDNLQKEDAVFIDNNNEGSASLSSIQLKDGPIVNNDNTLIGESEREELLELREKYASMQAHAEEWNNELSEKIHRLQSYLQNAYDENNELKLENNKLKDFVEDSRQLRSKCDELEDKSSYLVAELQACQGEICMLRSAEAKSDMKVKEYETVKLNLQNEVNDLNDRIKTLMKDLEDMRKEDEILFEVKQSYEQAVKQIGELTVALQGSEKSNIEVEELRNEVIKLVAVNEENIKLNAYNASLKQETDALQGKIKELIVDYNRIQAQLEMLSAENSISSEKVSLLEEELGRKQVENGQLENTVNLLQEESKEVVEKLQEKMILHDSRERYIKELEKDVATMKEEIERFSEIDDEKIELEIRLIGLQKKIATIEDLVEKYEDKVKEPTDKKLEQCLHGFKMQRMDLENLRKDYENLKKINIQLDKDKHQLLDKIEIADRIETERKKYVFEMEKGNEVVYNELEELRNIYQQEQIFGNEREKNERSRLALIEALIVERLSEQQESLRMCIIDAVNASDTSEMSFIENSKDTGYQYVEKVVTALFDEYEKLSVKVESMEKKIIELHDLRGKFDSLSKENIQLKKCENNLNMREKQLSDLQKKFDHISMEYESKKSEFNELKGSEKVFQKGKENNDLDQNNMKLLQDENSSLKYENERLQANLEVLGKEKQELLRIRDKYDELRTENITMKQNDNKRHLKEQQLSDLQKKLDQISKDYESKKSEVDELKETEKDLVKEKEKSNSLHNRMTHLQDENSSLKDENERLEANVEVLGKENQELLKIREKYDELRTENITMKQNDNKRHLKEQQLSDLQKKLDQISKEYESKKSEVDDLKETEKDLVKEKEKSNSLHNRMTHLQDENSSLKDENERLEANVEVLGKENQELLKIREKYDELRAENITMRQNENKRHLKEQQLSDLQKKLDQISNEYESKKSEVDDLKDTEKDLVKEKEKSNSLYNRMTHLQDENSSLKDENERLEANVEVLGKEKQELLKIREKYDELRAENITMRQNENKRHLKEQQLSDLQKKLDQICKEYELKKIEVNENKEASKNLEKEQKRNEKLQIDIKALHQQITVLKDENEILSLNSFELRGNLERNSYSLKIFTQKCSLLESENMELKEKANWVDILREENKELVYQIEFTGEELRSCRNAAIQNNEEVKQLNAKIFDLTKKKEFEQTKKARESGMLESICVLIGDKLDENKELFCDGLDLGSRLVSNKGQYDDGNDNDVIRNSYVRKTIKLLFSEVKQLAAKAALMEKDLERFNELRGKFDSVHKESIKMKQNENKHRLKESELLNMQQELASISENSEQILKKNGLLMKEITSLTASNECLRNENQAMSKDALELKQKLSSTFEAFQNEKEQTRLMDLEAKLLRQEMNALKEEKRELLNQSSVLKKELDECKCFIKQNDIFKAEQEKKNQQLNELVQGKESQLFEITNAINLKMMELEQLGAEKHDLSLALHKERKSAELACEANAELKTENEGLKSKVECYEATSAEIEELRNFLKNATENLEQFEREKEKLRDELTDAKNQTASYQDQCTNLKADMEREKGLMEGLVKEKDILDSNCCNLARDYEALSHKLKTCLCEKSQLENERSVLRNELDLVRSELDRKESQEEELQLLKSELLMIRGKAKEIWDKLLEMKAAAEHYSAENSKINSCLNEAREKMRFIQEENAVLTQEAIKLAAEKDALESFKFESLEMQKRLEIKTEELDITQKKYEELSKSLIALKKEMEELNYMENIRDLENQLLEAEDANVCIANERTAIEDQLKEVLKENVLLKDDIRINDNNRNEDLRVIGDLRKELMDVKEKLVILEENNDQLQAVSSERDEAGRRCMETERQTFEIDLQEQLKRIATLEESIGEQNRVIGEKEQKFQDLVLQVNSLTEEKNELLQQSSLSIVSSQRYEMKLQEKENAKHSLEKKVENLLETVRGLKSENEKMNQLYSHCLGNNEKLTLELRSLECKLNASQEQHDCLWEKYRETRKELKGRELEQARSNALQIESGKKTAAEPEMSLEESIHGSKELQRNMARRFLTSIARAQYCDVKPILKPKESSFKNNL